MSYIYLQIVKHDSISTLQATRCISRAQRPTLINTATGTINFTMPSSRRHGGRSSSSRHHSSSHHGVDSWEAAEPNTVLDYTSYTRWEPAAQSPDYGAEYLAAAGYSYDTTDNTRPRRKKKKKKKRGESCNIL